MQGQGVMEHTRSCIIINKVLNIPVENSEIANIDPCQDSKNKSIAQTTIELGS
jgi:hypothetical protein